MALWVCSYFPPKIKNNKKVRSRNHAPKNAVSLIVATQFHIEIDMTSKAYVFTNVGYPETLKLCSEVIISQFGGKCKGEGAKFTIGFASLAQSGEVRGASEVSPKAK